MSELPKTYLTECGWLKAGNPPIAGDQQSNTLGSEYRRNPFSQWASSTDLKRIAELAQKAVRNSPRYRIPICFAWKN
jgi:hypothetical protein